jgi:hypothetical protein
MSVKVSEVSSLLPDRPCGKHDLSAPALIAASAVKEKPEINK